MASLLNSFSQLMTPDTLGQISRVAGVDGSQAQKGLDLIGPLVLGSLARKSATVSGMDSIMRLLPQETTGSLLGNLLGASGRSAPGASPGLLTSVLGPGVSTIGKALGGRLGFDATPLLSVAAPAILGLISTTAKEQKLNSADIAKTLQNEHTATMATIKPEVQAVLTEAFQLSDKAEKLKATFTDDEWKQIRLTPVAATYYVVSASPSGFSGIAKEIIAAGDTMKSLVKNALPTSLVDVAFGSFEGKLDLEKDARISETAPRGGMLGVVRAAAASVKAKSPVDAQAFGDTIVTLSRKVAEASKEGGVLGIGGTRVSKEEEQALAEIASAVA